MTTEEHDTVINPHLRNITR